MKRVVAIVALLLVTACAPRYIRDTQIPDNEDTEAILLVMEKYRQALLAKDPPAIVKLLAPNFFDDAGTADPADDINAKNAAAVLGNRLAKISDIDLDVQVKRIDLNGDKATATYYYTEHYRIPSLDPNLQTSNDLKQMTFEKLDGVWKIASGI
jgi:hypothetical protein